MPPPAEQGRARRLVSAANAAEQVLLDLSQGAVASVTKWCRSWCQAASRAPDLEVATASTPKSVAWQRRSSRSHGGKGVRLHARRDSGEANAGRVKGIRRARCTGLRRGTAQPTLRLAQGKTHADTRQQQQLRVLQGGAGLSGSLALPGDPIRGARASRLALAPRAGRNAGRPHSCGPRPRERTDDATKQRALAAWLDLNVVFHSG